MWSQASIYHMEDGIKYECFPLIDADECVISHTIIIDIKECNKNKYWEPNSSSDGTLEIKMRNYSPQESCLLHSLMSTTIMKRSSRSVRRDFLHKNPTMVDTQQEYCLWLGKYHWGNSGRALLLALLAKLIH
ncbi:MAG: hypothetical protein ETSY1_26545 [Candidatus Entotheonella factor]|uniref:Uncharacterized protein n=1 Tax=Entotheonella factor TaxID=1429438 RepID=W4LGI7_ENTF1|nr:MAG: hypothetical protein ETSY1_26545 [Candidatus Entotheonella factor]